MNLNACKDVFSQRHEGSKNSPCYKVCVWNCHRERSLRSVTGVCSHGSRAKQVGDAAEIDVLHIVHCARILGNQEQIEGEDGGEAHLW